MPSSLKTKGWQASQETCVEKKLNIPGLAARGRTAALTPLPFQGKSEKQSLTGRQR